MGQQQLLLIVLGVIIVGVAIVVGINLFNANSEQAAKDTMISEATNIGAMAQQYYKKPSAMGGGNNSFAGFDGVVSTTLTDSGSTASYTVTPNGTTDCVIVGTPKDPDYVTAGWTVSCTVTPTAIRSTVVGGTGTGT